MPPTEIWIDVDKYWAEYPNHPGRSFGHPTPFTLDEYVSGVLLGELGSDVSAITNADLPSENNLWHQEVIAALAVAIRSFTWYRLNYASSFSDPHFITLDNINHCGFFDIGAQTFRPHYDQLRTPELQEAKVRYTNIVTQYVPNIYLVEGDGTEPIDAQYRASVSGYSEDGNKLYLIPIFNPISAGDVTDYARLGMGQWGAQRLAMGLNDAGEVFPPWVSYQQILFHFYTGVNLRLIDGDLLTPPPAVDRFNLLQISGQSTYFRPGKTYQVPQVILQNTGTNDWFVTQLSDASQSCDSSPTNLSYHLYQSDLVDLACGDQFPDEGENPSGVSCFEGYRNPLCLIDQAVITPGQHIRLSDVTVFIPPEPDLQPGGYWLRWDMEFLHPTDGLPPTWGSRLHLSPYNGEWFAQDKWVIIGKANYSEVRNLTSPSHQTSVWDNNPVINLSWLFPDDAIPTDHYRYRWRSNTGQVIAPEADSWACGDWRCTNDLEISTGLSDGEDWQVELYSMALDLDGEANQSVRLGPFQIDTTPPTATLTTLPQQITTSTYLLSWSGDDQNGSGIGGYELNYRVNEGEWQSVAGVGQLDITAITFSFPEGQQGDIYTFCLVATDQVGYHSTPACQTTRYTPYPEFEIRPQIIWRMQLEGDPTPLTETIHIQNSGGGVLTWTATTPVTWLTLGRESGLAPATLPLTFSSGLTVGDYNSVITFSGPVSTTNQPQVLSVTVKVVTDFYHLYLPLIVKGNLDG